MKNVLYLILLLLLASCTPPTKTEALDYYIDVKFETAYDLLIRLDDQRLALKEYLRDPSKLSKGPDAATHQFLLREQNDLILILPECINTLEAIDDLGDAADYRETLISYLYLRLNNEKRVMLKIVKLLENGMTSEESKFLNQKNTREMIQLQKRQELMFNNENKFLREFGITDAEITKELELRGYY